MKQLTILANNVGSLYKAVKTYHYHSELVKHEEIPREFNGLEITFMGWLVVESQPLYYYRNVIWWNRRSDDNLIRLKEGKDSVMANIYFVSHYFLQNGAPLHFAII